MSATNQTMGHFLRTVEETITNYRMIRPSETVLVGLSGGPDSVALLYCLHLLSKTRGFHLAAAHLNHGLRPQDAETDAAFAGTIASTLQIPITIDTRAVREFQRTHKLSLEEAARVVRHNFLLEAAKSLGCACIALGHHADDNAEQVLMNFLRGSGLTGLSGIPAVRPLGPSPSAENGITLIRPLIRVTKRQIYTFLKTAGLSWRTDLSNSDTRLFRNRIRHELLPMLKQRYNPHVVETLNRFARLAGNEDRWISELLTPTVNRMVIADGPGLLLSVSELREQPQSVAGRIVRTVIKRVKGDLRRISLQHVESVLGLCLSDANTARIDLPDQIQAKRNGDQLRIFQSNCPLRESAPSFLRPVTPACRYQIERPGTFSLSEFGMTLSAEALSEESIPDFQTARRHEAFLDLEKIHFPLIARPVHPGDKFWPMGASGSQKLKKFFIDHKIPPAERAKCAVLVSGNDIIWVMGYRIDDRYKITPSTKKILKIELNLAEPIEGD